MIHNNGQLKKDYLRDDSLFASTNPEESELAYQLQNEQPGDLDVYRTLVYRYASSMYTWIDVLLTYYRSTPPEPEEVIQILQEVFISAIKHIDQFHGQVSVINWLFTLSYPLIKNKRISVIQGLRLKRKLEHNNYTIIEGEKNQEFWQKLDSLPERFYLVVILRYLFDLSISDIAYIFKIQENVAHKRLMMGRSRLLAGLEKSHKANQIQAYLDSLPDEDQQELFLLEQHIIECQECQTTVIKLKDLEQTLANSTKKRWNLSSINDDTLKSLIQSIISRLTGSTEQKLFQPHFRQSAWFFGFTLLFLLLAVIFINLTPVEKEFPQSRLTPTAQLPPIIEMSPAVVPSTTSNRTTIAPRFVEPDFSSDGNWVVFSSIKADPVTGMLSMPTIELFDKSANTIKVIHESNGNLNAIWSGWDLAPSISANGQWVAFTGTMDTPKSGDNPCLSPLKNNCLDIFVYDRDTEGTKQITQAWNGSAANGISLSPAISADGVWVSFWSTATNLVEGDEITCQGKNRAFICLFVYFYNQKTGLMNRAPMGTSVDGSGTSIGPISLSSDGRYIGYTISIKGQLTYPTKYDEVTYDILGNIITRARHYRAYDYFDITTEAIIYDRDTGQVEIVNRSPNGSIGDGASSTPVLSGDGQYVAFVSGSTNLVDGDTNGSIDVFVRDRVSGMVEVVSINSADELGNSNSGFTQWRRGYNNLDISADGRYVVFESTATNLGQRLDSDCYYYQTTNCILLYLHDRQTGQTELISALPNGDFLRYPKISSDGRWITFMQSKYSCSVSQEYCSNVMLYDKGHNWLRNLTNYGAIIPDLPWSYAGSVKMPWQLWESKAMGFSTDGSLLAIGGMDSKIRIWRLEGGANSIIDEEPMQILSSGKNDTYTEIKFSPNGSWLTAGTAAGIVYIWRFPGGELIYSIDEKQGFVRDLVFAKDCSQLVISTSEFTSIWRIEDKQLSHLIRHAHGSTKDLSPSGDLLAMDDGNGITLILKLPMGEIIGRLDNGHVPIKDMAFSEDASMLAVRLEDGMINLWQIQEFKTSSFNISAANSFQSIAVNGELSFSPDDMYLTSTGTYGDVVMWRVSDGKMYIIPSSFKDKRVASLAFSKSGDTLAVVVENEIILWKNNKEILSQYFKQSHEDTYSETGLLVETNTFDTARFLELDQKAVGKYANLTEAANNLTFPLIVPTHLPEYINFLETIEYSDGSICLLYEFSHQKAKPSLLYICERYIANSPPPMMAVGASADIIPIDIDTNSGQKRAEYVHGDWIWEGSRSLVPDYITNGVTNDVWKWDLRSASQNLRWVQYGILISLYYQVETPLFTGLSVIAERSELNIITSYLNQMDLVQIASAMSKYEEVKTNYFYNNGG